MIEINNLTSVSVDEEFLRGVAKKVLEDENKKEATFSIALIGQGRIKELNKKYRGKNRATDVLAFPGDGLPVRHSPEAKSMAGRGEIAICLREVKKNAKRFNSAFEKELARVLIHGILHLLGYDHEKNEARADEMRKKEEHYLNQIRI